MLLVSGWFSFSKTIIPEAGSTFSSLQHADTLISSVDWGYGTRGDTRIPVIPWDASFRFGSAKHLGEDAAGEWTLRITDHYAADTGSLRSWKLTAYGHRLKPEAPDIDELYPAPGGFTATWKEPSDAGQGSISAYDVRYIKTSEDETDDDNWTVVDDAWTSGPLQYTASGLTVGTQYDVQVRAVNSHGDGPWSETVAVTPSTDEAPNVLSVMPGDRRLTVAWTAPTNASLGTITSYDLRYKRTSSGNTWTVVDEIWDSTTGGALEYTLNPTDTPLVNGTSYDVQVRAVEDDSEHPWSETRYATPRGVPGAPTIRSVDSDDGKLAVEWNQPPNNGGAEITFYDLRYIKTSADETVDHDWTVVPGVWSSKSDPLASDLTGLDNWVKYDVQARAENTAGAGDWSATATGTPTNTDVRVTLEWARTSVTADENAGSAILQATATTDRDKALPSDFFFDVTVETATGTAIAGDDYVQLLDSATFDEGDFSQMEVGGQQRYRATKGFTVSIINDDEDESNETFTATLAYVNPDIPNLREGNTGATVTIADDEHVPVTLGWAQDAVSVHESAGAVTLNATATTTVDKRPEPGFSFDATVSTSSVSADESIDYTRVSTTVTFRHSDSWRATGGAYQATKSTTIPIIDDTRDERNETFEATVEYATTPRPIHLTGGPATATVTITDNDLPTVTIDAYSGSATEGDTLSFTLRRDGITDDSLTVNVRVTETGSLLATNQPTTATFTAGSSSVDLEVGLADDTEDEDDSTVTVEVRSGSGYALGLATSTQATVADNDHVPVTLSWDRTSVTVAERAGTVTLRAVAATTKDKQPESGFSFDATLTTADGTADSADYSLGTTSQPFSRSDFTRTTVNGQQRYRATQEFTISIVSDGVDEPDETFTATVDYANALPHLQGGDDTMTVTISDNDDPLVSITAESQTASEADGSISFMLTRDGQTEASLRVNVRVTESGNMLARGAPNRVSLGADSSEATLLVNLVDDTADEDNSVITAEVLAGTGYLPGSPGSAQSEVSDDDHVPVTIAWQDAELTVVEGAGQAVLNAVATTTKDKMPEPGFSFDVIATTSDGSARQPGDYESLSQTSGTATFNRSDFSRITVGSQSYYQAAKGITVIIENDILDEDEEKFTVALAYADSSPPHLQGRGDTATVTITDDDYVPVVLGWEQAEWSVRERDGAVTLRAAATTTQDRQPEQGFSVEVRVNSRDGTATQPGDYESISATVTFTRDDFSRTTVDGQRRYRATQDFTVSIENDGGGEDNEKFSVNLTINSSSRSDVAVGDGTATVWIIEDETNTADLRLTRNNPPSNVMQGNTLTYEYTVANRGPTDATGVELVSTLDPNLNFYTTDQTSNCSHSGGSGGGEVECDWSDLPSGESETVSVEVTVRSVPESGIVNRARVTSSSADPSPGDNVYPSAGKTTPPSRPPPSTGGGGGGGGGGPVNSAPEFQDADGNEITETTRVIAEDAAPGTNIGAPVSATDADEDALTYTLSGDDTASFEIDASTGQLTTATMLDYETQDSYTVTVTVTAADPSGQTAEIRVNITVVRVQFDCSLGNAVADAAGNPALVTDCEALLGSRDQLAGTAALNWSDDIPITAWDGVRLGGTPKRVVWVYLPRRDLDGAIPSDLGSLSELKGLYLHHNELTGPIPPQLGQLSSLVHLTLHRNRLVGEIPAELGDLNHLVFLSLYGNELTGELPEELGGLSNLRWLYLHSNKTADGDGLRGVIPSTFRNLDNLERLMLYGNSLSGAMPTGLGELSNLKSLLLHDNELTGQIPSALGNMSSLRYLWLDDNHLSGEIPARLGNLTNLRWLSLYGNELTGEIPGELGDLSTLRLLILDRNNLSGAIPARLGELSELTWLALNDNDLTGPIPGELGDLSNLEHLYLHGNGLTGTVPPDLARLTNLTNLWLRDNLLLGQIPPALGDLPNLQRVRIGGNSFTGCIPDGLLGGPRWYSDAEELGLPACGDGNGS